MLNFSNWHWSVWKIWDHLVEYNENFDINRDDFSLESSISSIENIEEEEMLTARPRASPPSRLAKPQQQGKHPVLDAIWRAKWPIAASSAVASLMVICVLILVALEIAHLAKGTDTNLYGTTSVTGAGFWCGFTLLLAAFFIFMISE